MRDGNSTPPGGLAGDQGDPDASAPTVPAPREAPGEPGSVHVILSPDRTTIVLSGEVDADLGPDLTQATTDAEQAGVPIEVDAHHVTFMDSSGVAFLARLASRTPHRVRLLHVPPTVQFLLEVTRIGELLDVVEDAPRQD
ncbi:STAS domain-containing protein [Cellulomonas triticagri]|uniref:Anti-sigma factor antagonist n=1 Tax=Cellulomonas triticagri TaxID=2483352 RepID=A0A3M2JNX8_9CELL|nr:anti-sigma factor antagonist [Cellulomonas triticagri]